MLGLPCWLIPARSQSLAPVCEWQLHATPVTAPYRFYPQCTRRARALVFVAWACCCCTAEVVGREGSCQWVFGQAAGCVSRLCFGDALAVLCWVLDWLHIAVCPERIIGSCELVQELVCLRSAHEVGGEVEHEVGGEVASALVGDLGAGWVFPAG